MNLVLSGFNFSLFVESHLLISSRQCDSLQLCFISIEMETNPRMILYDYTQGCSLE